MRLIEPDQITKMMSDLYISEDAVNMTGERQGLWVRFRAIEKAVSEIPTIDAVEVVRCEDCKWAEKAILDEYCVECTMYHTSCARNGYCHHGERKGGDTE